MHWTFEPGWLVLQTAARRSLWPVADQCEGDSVSRVRPPTRWAPLGETRFSSTDVNFHAIRGSLRGLRAPLSPELGITGETSRVSTHSPVVMRKLSDEQGPLEKGHMGGRPHRPHL